MKSLETVPNPAHKLALWCPPLADEVTPRDLMKAARTALDYAANGLFLTPCPACREMADTLDRFVSEIDDLTDELDTLFPEPVSTEPF